MDPDKQKKWDRRFWKIVLAPVAFIFLMIVLVAIFAKIPSFEELEDPDNNLSTLLISEDGKVFSDYHIENRSYVEYEDIPLHVVDAAVATEDARFYRHSGIDFRGLARVGFKTILMGNSSQGGGSTITQQLAKSLYPRESVRSKIPGVKTFKMVITKFKEWITAVKLERNYTKEEIMTMYLNTIFFGSNAYGIQAAAATFFNKTPQQLTVEEGACLVGMVNKPTRYNPVVNPDKSLERRNHVLRQMSKYGYITDAECDSLSTIPIKLNYHQIDHNSGLGSYFRDMLRRTMNATAPHRSDYDEIEDYRVDSLLWKDDPLYGWLNKNLKADGTQYNLDRDGLKIYTTIDSRMQQYAEDAVRQHLGTELQKAFNNELRYKTNRPFSNRVSKEKAERVMRQAIRWSDRYRGMKEEGASENEIMESFHKPVNMRVFSWNKERYIDTVMTPYDSIKYYKSFLRCAMIAMEPNSGKVKAYVGGPDYRYFKYDNARQGKRQVGSTIKPYLYTLAMQEGFKPCDKVLCKKYTFNTGGGRTWSPRSGDRASVMGSHVTLKWGLTHSSNNVSAYLMKQYGPYALVDMCHRLGIGSHMDPVPSLCVGSCDLSVYEMVAAYNTYPSRGVYASPMLVTRIEDKTGNVLAEFTPRKRDAISDRTAYLVVDLMKGVVNEGTASRLKYKYGLAGIAGKTGTTNDNSDGWFIGYSPKLTAGVWVGFEDRQVHFESTALGQGANAALPIFGLFMKKVYDDPSINIGKDDRFMPPLGWSDHYVCTGRTADDIEDSSSGGGRRSESNTSYFD